MMGQKRECEGCGEEKSAADIHSAGYHRRADMKAGDPMTTLAYLCEDCIADIFGEVVDIDNEYTPRRDR